MLPEDQEEVEVVVDKLETAGQEVLVEEVHLVCINHYLNLDYIELS